MDSEINTDIQAALVLSTLATAPSAGAASKKKPTLNVKKKTLYWNKAGKKNYTLKMKKNKVRMIIATTWKTSKKSVVALSKKKETSVRLTAKKKGKATITATVKYVPAKKWEVKTAKLTCKVTSKGTEASTPQPTDAPVPTYPFPMFSMPAQSFMPQSTATAKPEETPGADGSAIPDTTPGADESEKPDETEKPSGAPEETPGGDFVVSEVVLSETEALLGVTEGKNSVTLTAEVRDQDGEPVENADVTWTSDDEGVAVVSDGIVEAVQGGTANITASVNGVTSQPCVVTVDDQRPVIEGAVLSDYKTFSVYFSEPVTGDPEVSVTEGDTDVAYDSLHLSEDGKAWQYHTGTPCVRESMRLSSTDCPTWLETRWNRMLLYQWKKRRADRKVLSAKQSRRRRGSHRLTCIIPLSTSMERNVILLVSCLREHLRQLPRRRTECRLRPR